MPREAYDVAIVGGGPNGLTAAAYLARAGASVAVLERRFERGGTFATDDYSTPFQYNLAQFELPLAAELPPYRDLHLHAEGVRFVEPELAFSARPEPGAAELVVRRGGRGLGEEIEEMLAEAVASVGNLLYRPPGDPEGAPPGLAECTPRTLAERADDARAGIILRYACGMSGFLDGDTPLGPIGAFALARLFSPAIVVGGTKNLANGIARVAAGAGARAFVSSEVTRVEAGDDGFRLMLSDGRHLGARAVVSTLDPRATFLGLLDHDEATAELRTSAEAWVLDATGPFTAHFGIKGDPPTPATSDMGDALIRVFGFSDAGDVERRFEAALQGELLEPVAGHLTAVSAHDPLQASPGPYGPLHTLRLQATVPYDPGGDGWDRRRTAYRRECWDAAVANFDGLEEARLLFEFCDTPLDIERRFRTTLRGSVRQGALTAAQTLTRRPHPSCSGARTPIAGLYLGGGGVHPGVPGCLGGGYNVAAVVAEDLGLERWWPEA
jgi:phytoene dehydrogenase-like protein